MLAYLGLVSVILASWDYRRQSQQENTQRGPVPASYSFEWLLPAHVSCVLTLALHRGGVIFINAHKWIDNPFSGGAGHGTGICQHSLGGGAVSVLQRRKEFQGILSPF